jgi:hypothetical protein
MNTLLHLGFTSAALCAFMGFCCKTNCYEWQRYGK